MNKFKIISLAASTMLALAFTSCSSDESDDGGGSSSSLGGGDESSSSVVVVVASCPVSAEADGLVTCGGQAYKTVQIGEQVWFAENLNYDPGTDTDASTCYEGKASNCATYGRLYNWETAMTACPSGWHLPTRAEFEELGDDAIKLKATSGWGDDGVSVNGTDDYGFSALPGGGRDGYDGFFSVDDIGHWWSSSARDDSNVFPYFLVIHYSEESTRWDSIRNNFMYSVRCIKD